MSEALILQSVNPQYNDRLFIDSWLQYKKNTTSEHVVYKHCFLFMFWSSKQCLYTTCSQLVFFLYWIQEWMHNLSSYCGLTYSRISASEKDLPVIVLFFVTLSTKSKNERKSFYNSAPAELQVNLFQKRLFSYQLTHNMKKRLFIELQV